MVVLGHKSTSWMEAARFKVREAFNGRPALLVSYHHFSFSSAQSDQRRRHQAAFLWLCFGRMSFISFFSSWFWFDDLVSYGKQSCGQNWCWQVVHLLHGQLLHLQNRRDFFSIYRCCTCSQRRASWSFLQKSSAIIQLHFKLVQG